MKQITKKLFIPTLALSLLSAGAVFAAETDVPVLDMPSAEETAAAPAVNGAVVDHVAVELIGGIPMLPLRSVAEGLGYTVTWNEEDQSVSLTKGAQYIHMRLGEDSYSFSRRAPQQLGSAPVLKDDTLTYVPLAFISDILNGYFSENEDGTYKIVNPSIVTVTSVNENGTLTVSDSYLGEVIVHLDENTVITGGEKECTLADIQPDMVLAVEYSPAMTASIPPQTTAITVRIENLPTESPSEEAVEEIKDEVAFSGVITEINGDKVMVGEVSDPDSICLIVNDDTWIHHAINKRLYRLEDLEIGMKISGTHSMAATFSIPPQSVAFSIQIDNE